MAQPCVIVPESKVEGGTGPGIRYFLSPDVLPINSKRREQIKKECMVIRADIRNPSHSKCDSHAEHKFSNTITGCTQPRSESFGLHGSFSWGCSHLGAFTLVVEAEWWHVLIDHKCASTQFCLELLLPRLFVFCCSKLVRGWASRLQRETWESFKPGRIWLTGKPQPWKAWGD